MEKDCLNALRGLPMERPDEAIQRAFSALVAKAKYDAIRMIRSAGSGHIGGSMSSAECLALALLAMDADAGDRVIVSHGHIAPIYYSLLGNLGYFDPEEAVRTLRRGGLFEGHPSIAVNGVSWCSGILGQGLSVGAGFALAEKRRGRNGRIAVLMGDGEQNKGQILEAARFAAKYHLDNLCCIVDWNHLQASGTADEIMPMALEPLFRASGFEVIRVDGHCLDAIYGAMRRPCQKPRMILAETVMCSGIEGAENDCRFHGTMPSGPILDRAQEELYCRARNAPVFESRSACTQVPVEVVLPERIQYPPETKYACRDAAASAVIRICGHNPLATVFDCDLLGSMKLQKLQENHTGQLIECGISEHNAASVSAGTAKSGLPAFWFDFGVMNLDEAYSQIRMAQINKAPLKLIATHCGLDVGEDGKTHQCTDYIGIASHLYDVRLIIPADANQAEAAVRAMAKTDKMSILACGRSAVPVITDEKGLPLYRTEDCLGTTTVREGSDAVVFSCGTMLHKAVAVADRLKEAGIHVRVANVSEPLSLSEDCVLEAAKTGAVITYEDHNVRTGLGSIVAGKLAGKALCQFKAMGLQNHGGSAAPDALYEQAGLSESHLYRQIVSMLKG